MTGLPDDPSDRPTRMAEYNVDGSLRQGLDAEPEAAPGGPEPDSAPQPWYRNRVLVVLWALMVALLLTLIIYGIVELSRGGGTSIPAPHSSTTPTPSSTTSPAATTTPSAPSEAPPPETPEQTPAEAPPPANNSPAPGEPPHHHHHLHVPSTIPLPHTTITLPHGF